MSARDRFESVLSTTFNLSHLEMVVSKSLGQTLEYFVSVDSLPVTVNRLMTQLEDQDRQLSIFLLYLMNGAAKIKDAAIEYYEEYFKIPLPISNPYGDLVVFNDAFVDRQDFRDKLKKLFDPNNSFYLLTTKGPRYSGRSHCASFIKHVARSESIEAIVLDMLNATVGELVAELIDQMRLPVTDFRDRMAQYSTQSKGFISALKGIMREPAFRTNRYCIVFDHHDLPEVSPEVRAFAEGLMQEVAKSNLPPNVYIILLGQGAWSVYPSSLNHQIVDVEAPYIEATDVERYLTALASKTNQTLGQQELQKRKEEILDSLNLKELGGMLTMSDRLRKYFS